MGKIEKSLEINITHEILSLADSFWWYLQPIALRRYWRPSWRLPLIMPPNCYASGLALRVEGTKGGYDVCIHSPNNFIGGNERLLYMQFKAGIEKPFNSNPNSHFYGDQANHNIHVEFDINSNKNRNQHRLLTLLAKNSGNKNAVVYVFPRVVDEVQLQRHAGNLLRRTTFFSIEDMDKNAATKNIQIDDGNPHKFRTCYKDWKKNEINLLLLLLLLEGPGKEIAEVFAIRMYRALIALQKILPEDFPILKTNIIDSMLRHVLHLGIHFGIPFQNITPHFENLKQFRAKLEVMRLEGVAIYPYEVSLPENEMAQLIFNNIIKSLSLYFDWIEQIKDFEKSEIPLPPKNYTIELPPDGLRFPISTSGQQNNFEPDDLNEITYSLF